MNKQPPRNLANRLANTEEADKLEEEMDNNEGAEGEGAEEEGNENQPEVNGEQLEGDSEENEEAEPATEEETLQILNNIKDNYEDHHSVTFTPEALKACVELPSRYITDRFLPDKAIDVLDEAGSLVHISNINVPKEIVDIEKKSKNG